VETPQQSSTESNLSSPLKGSTVSNQPYSQHGSTMSFANCVIPEDSNAIYRAPDLLKSGLVSARREQQTYSHSPADTYSNRRQGTVSSIAYTNLSEQMEMEMEIGKAASNAVNASKVFGKLRGEAINEENNGLNSDSDEDTKDIESIHYSTETSRNSRVNTKTNHTSVPLGRAVIASSARERDMTLQKKPSFACNQYFHFNRGDSPLDLLLNLSSSDTSRSQSPHFTSLIKRSSNQADTTGSLSYQASIYLQQKQHLLKILLGKALYISSNYQLELYQLLGDQAQGTNSSIADRKNKVSANLAEVTSYIQSIINEIMKITSKVIV
jgi:hypothetical protein